STLLLGMACLAELWTANDRTPLEATLWGVFCICGFVTFPVLLYEAAAVFLRTPSIIAVFPSGLAWKKWGRQIVVRWSEINRVHREVTTFARFGKTYHYDTTTIYWGRRKKLRFWLGVLSDYQTFASSVKHFHDNAQFAAAPPLGPIARMERPRSMRCWHCGDAFAFKVTDPSAQVRCPRCKCGLGTVLP